MKIFVSHQKNDSVVAARVAQRLKDYHQIDVYLDLIDPETAVAGDALGDHLRAQLGACSHLLAVVSSNTKSSWWVPWEIGIATEKEYPISTYADGTTSLPEYLKKWPYLMSTLDLDTYAQEAKAANRKMVVQKSQGIALDAVRRDQTRSFHSALRAALGQAGTRRY